nr:MAG TPA: hypothetical protein [Caudoviricetes sp.]
MYIYSLAPFLPSMCPSLVYVCLMCTMIVCVQCILT